MKMDEQELMRRVQKGDEMAFEQIVRIYKDKIVNFLYQMTNDYQKAVELSQETFMRVYFKANKYKPMAPLSSWIYTIASNLAKTELKKSRKFLTVSYDEVKNHSKLGDVSMEPSTSVSIKIIKRALSALHPRYRIPVILKDIEGFSQDEIAQILRVPVGTVKARISRGRDYLKKEIEKFNVNNEMLLNNREFKNGRA